MPAEPICLSRCGSYAINFGDGQALVLAPLEAAPVRDQRDPWLIMCGRPDRLAMPAQKTTLMTCLESASLSLKIAHASRDIALHRHRYEHCKLPEIVPVNDRI